MRDKVDITTDIAPFQQLCLLLCNLSFFTNDTNVNSSKLGTCLFRRHYKSNIFSFDLNTFKESLKAIVVAIYRDQDPSFQFHR